MPASTLSNGRVLPSGARGRIGSWIASEAVVAAWAEEGPGRVAIRLRFGWFEPAAPAGRPAQEARRLDAGTLATRPDAALAWNGPGGVVRYAVGRKRTERSP